MLFTSIIFLCFFLPITVVGYYLVPSRFKNLFILLASLVFYIWGEKFLVVLLMSTIAMNYGCSILISKGYRKIGIYTAVIGSLASLFYFKYATFTYTNIVELMTWLGMDTSTHIVPQIALPLGISFFTFQVLSYTIDVYRGVVPACKSFLNFSTYVTLFPHLVAGPIVRYAHIEEQLIKKDLSTTRVAEGIERFVLGLAKKMFIANNCGLVADTIFNIDPEFYTPGAAWLAAIAYSLQIFFDFSAYSDMAIGLAKIFGFDFHENFNYPYISRSIKDFWRRWHISLSSWFRDYLYIPLGGSRVSNFRLYVNLFTVFFATGLWHGASWNFVFWGVWHGCFIVIERLGFQSVLDRLWKPLQHVYLLLIVIIGWVFFRVENFSEGVIFLKRMFLIDNRSVDIVYDLSYFITRKNIAVFVIAFMLCFPAFTPIRNKISELAKKNQIVLVAYYIFLLVLLVSVMSMLSIGTYNPFIYFRF